MLGDEDADVRLAVIEKLNTKVPGPERNETLVMKVLPVLLPSYYGLIEDSRWRVRHSAIKFIPLLAEQLGMDMFTESLTDIAADTLHDEASDNREEACNNIRTLYEMFGAEWISSKILPKMGVLSRNENYLIRIQSIRVVSCLASGPIDSDFLSSSAIPMLSELAMDITPNVKFNVAKCLKVLGSSLDEKVIDEEVKPILMQLKKDVDQDVVYYATSALEAFN